MKKVVLSLILILSVLMCGKKEESKTAEQSAAENKLPEKIVIGLDDTFAPMGFRDEKGELVGFDIDLAKAVGEKLGIAVEFQPINWDTKDLELKNGNINLIWNGLTITEERKKQMLFSDPYLENSQVIVLKKDSAIKTKEDLAGKVIGTQSKSSGEEAVLKDPVNSKLKELRTYDTYDQAFLDLDAGRIEAIVADEVLARFIKTNKEKKEGKDLYVILNSDNFGKEEYGIGAKSDNTFLISKINEALAELKKDGTYKKIHDKWFGSN